MARHQAAQGQLKVDLGLIGGLRLYRRCSWLKRATQTTGLVCGEGLCLVGCAKRHGWIVANITNDGN
jgi:hypothetical protein